MHLPPLLVLSLSVGLGTARHTQLVAQTSATEPHWEKFRVCKAQSHEKALGFPCRHGLAMSHECHAAVKLQIGNHANSHPLSLALKTFIYS
jgi:hypothetical protein